MQKHQRLVLAIAVLASFVAFLDGSVINVALPAIMRELGGGLSTQQWVVDAYLITLGSLILVAGSLSDVFGRIIVLRWGLAGFGVASLICAIAPTAEVLIVARGLQGVAGALLVPSSLAIILSTFRGPEQAKAIGSWTAWTSAAFIAGPLLGGIFVDVLSWRYVFAINVLPIVVTLWLLFVLKQKDEREPGVSIDWLGAILGVFGLGLPVFALIEQGRYGWTSPAIYLPMVFGVLALGAFFWRESVARQPMVPLGLFRVRNFAVGNVATTAIYGALSIGGFLLAVFLQQVGGYKATVAGIAILPVTIISILFSSYIGALAGRFGPRIFMTVGPIIGGLGYLYFLRMGASPNYWTDVLPGVILFGIGLTITVAPLTSAILGAIDQRQAGIGSAINNAVSRVAGLIAIAMLGLIIGPLLDVDGFHRGMVVTACLLFAGGVASGLGIRNLPHPAEATAAASPEGLAQPE
ncbi:MFS transporter [Lacisediminihabitans profunda]|uniref:MFS transporter n=1 Tax=Lacisediminihabitans profunda TaxID=2594790 RepID=A0A5C8UXJ9_9MICO|nr:MFS transporter [Lacisediminihabitans profunda]TXN32820.1 MFS transporter [Lacisediminihabitans profunda]